MSESRKISSRTREHLERKARRGLVAGGSVYGYRNEPSPDGAGKVRVLDEHQAAVVREIFGRYAAGEGLRTIVKALNARGEPPPRAGRRGGASWAPSAIHEMLRRVLYIGRIEWGRAHKTYRGGTKTRTDRHAHDLVAVEAPHLRIVGADLWDAVQAQIAQNARPRQGAEAPSPRRAGRPATYLLSGILRCGSCKGPLTVINGKAGSDPIKVYACARRRDRGDTACGSTLRRKVGTVDGAILDWVRREVLTEGMIGAVLAEVRRRVAARVESTRSQVQELERATRRLRRDVDALAERSIEAPPEARPALYRLLGERQQELASVEDRLRAAATVPGAVDLELRRLERDARQRLEELRELGSRNPEEGRALLRALFPGGLTASSAAGPEGGRSVMRIEGVASPASALGIPAPTGNGGGTEASPAGFEPA